MRAYCVSAFRSIQSIYYLPTTFYSRDYGLSVNLTKVYKYKIPIRFYLGDKCHVHDFLLTTGIHTQ